MKTMTTVMLVMMLAGCAASTTGPVSTLSGNYKAGAPNYTSDGHSVICDSAGPVGRSVTRC